MKKKLTIVKIGDGNYTPSPGDLERWRQVFAGELSQEEMLERHPHLKNVGVECQQLVADTVDDHFITIVRIGDETYSPTSQDLEEWRKVFEEASADPDFKIFTHSKVDIKQYRLDMETQILVEK